MKSERTHSYSDFLGFKETQIFIEINNTESKTNALIIFRSWQPSWVSSLS